jgi:hypothetical protein
MPNSSITDLYDYLSAKLLGSTLQVIRTENEIRVEAGDILSITITMDKKEKIVYFTLFSKILNRPVTVEEVNGTLFMESRLEEELEKEDRVAIGEDGLLAVDLLHLWAKENGHEVKRTGVEDSRHKQSELHENKEIAEKAKSGSRPKDSK